MVTPKFVWTEWKDKKEDCVSFEYEGKEFRSSTDAKPHKWDDAVQSLTGTTAVRCYEDFNLVGEPVKAGVGYYSFTLRLKEGYAWEDGLGPDTYGDTSPKVYRWAVVEDDSVTTASINIHKTVEWSSTSNATVTVTTFTSPEMQGKGELEILFIGSLCNRHNLQATTVSSVMNCLVDKGNVDWAFFNNKGTDNTYTRTEPYATGHFDMGATVRGLPALSQSTHANLMGCLTLIANRLDPESPTYKNYDYIVLEFDTDRLFEFSADYTAQNAQLADKVARFLKPYYESNSMIWVVDNAKDRNPFVSGDLNFWFTPTSWNEEQGQTSLAVDGKWNYEVALLDPITYMANENGQRYVGTLRYNNRTYYTANRYETQVTYDNAADVLELLNNTIKIKPYNLNLRDKIKDGDSGLTLNSVSILTCTKGEGGVASTNASDWVELMKWHMDTSTMEWMDRDGKSGITGGGMQVYAASNLVTAVLSNVDFTVWTKVKIGIVDDGHFRTSEDAYYNQFTGKWEKNPNEGTAFAEMMDNLGNALNIEGEDLALIDEEYVTNGWFVTSTYTKGMGMGLYDTWVRDEDNPALWDGDPAFLEPDVIDPENHIFNFGNYYLVNRKNGQAVEKLPIEIGKVPQMPGLDPEGEFAETGVEPAWKLYDGLPTNLVVNVTSINPSNVEHTVLIEEVDYTIAYALADLSDPTHPTTPCTFEETKRLHAGTNVVWYWVEPIGIMSNVYFAANQLQGNGAGCLPYRNNIWYNMSVVPPIY